MTDALETTLRHLEPHGLGNAAPVFAARGVRHAAAPRRVGADGLRLAFRTPDGGEVGAIAWGLADRLAWVDPHAPVDVAFRLERDTFRGADALQLRVADVVPAGHPAAAPAR